MPIRLYAEALLDAGRYDWFHFIGRSSLDGCCWVKEFERHGRWVARRIDDVVLLLRRREVALALEGLDETRCSIDELNVSVATRAVLDRWHLSALAYFHYVVADLAAAEETLDEALEAARRGIEAASFLVPLAYHAYDFCLQRARIARNGRRWDAMTFHIETGRAMLENQIPLCRLDDGTPIFINCVDCFFMGIQASSPDEEEALALHTDAARRRSVFERAVLSLSVLPDFVIPYR